MRVADAGGVGLLVGCGPAAEAPERFRVPRAGLGAVGGDGQAGVGDEVDPVVGEAEVADDREGKCLKPVMCWRTLR